MGIYLLFFFSNRNYYRVNLAEFNKKKRREFLSVRHARSNREIKNLDKFFELLLCFIHQ